ncbi:hypothetical protein Trydic_g13858 [Trypoxylus dichotomus]
MDSDNSSSDSDSVIDEVEAACSQRSKRSVGGVEWCDTNDVSPPPRAHVEWPPPEGQTVDLRSSFMGNPNFSQTMQLFSRTNHFLAAYPDGTVRGTQDSTDVHTIFEIVNAGDIAHVKIQSKALQSYVAMNEKAILEVSNAGETGHVRIMCLLSRVYIAMDKKGKLYAETNRWMEGTVWIESYIGGYNTYLSRLHSQKGWYLGIKKSGGPKKGPKTGEKQKAVKFLPVRRKR